jgi:hypothetical protein
MRKSGPLVLEQSLLSLKILACSGSKAKMDFSKVSFPLRVYRVQSEASKLSPASLPRCEDGGPTRLSHRIKAQEASAFVDIGKFSIHSIPAANKECPFIRLNIEAA